MVNEKQEQKIGHLVSQYAKNGAVTVSINQTPFDLPSGWIITALMDKYNNHILTVGIDPEGNAHS